MAFDFYNYMREFEEKVVAEGVRRQIVGRIEKVTVRDGKLANRHFGKIMRGNLLDLSVTVAIDYYGLIKKSLGFWNLVAKAREQFKGQQVKSMDAPVVHFAAVRIETIAELAPELVADFPTFKKTVLRARGFVKETYQ